MGRKVTDELPFWNCEYRPRPSPTVQEIPPLSGDLSQFESCRNIFNSVYSNSSMGETTKSLGSSSIGAIAIAGR